MMPPTPWQWQFPPCPQWVPSNNRDRDEQVQSILREANEARTAFDEIWWNGMLPYVMELMDVIHACETALREFEPRHLDAAKMLVIRKNDDRGYYDDGGNHGI